MFCSRVRFTFIKLPGNRGFRVIELRTKQFLLYSDRTTLYGPETPEPSRPGLWGPTQILT